MAVTDSFLATCRDLIEDLSELATFRTALARVESASGANAENAAWSACFSDNQADLSPAYRARKAIREIVLGQGEALTIVDRESAYRTLSAAYVPQWEKPATEAEEQATLASIALAKLAE